MGNICWGVSGGCEVGMHQCYRVLECWCLVSGVTRISYTSVCMYDQDFQ